MPSEKDKRIAVLITVARPVPYVHRLLQSLYDTGFHIRYPKLHIVAGGPDTTYLDPYRGKDGYEIHEMSAVEKDLWGEMGGLPRCAFGHYRMLRLIEDYDWEEALLIEDDIIFARGWHQYLGSILPEIREAHGDQFMLALYQHHMCKVEYEQGHRWYPLKSDLYYGGLAELHTRESVKGLPEYLWRTSMKGTMASDFATGKHLRRRGITLLATAPSLVQHIGEVSVSGISGAFHKAEFFREIVVYSQLDEEYFIFDFFKKNPPRSKVFCDVGAFDGLINSNTRALFEAGWTGILVEPNPIPYEKLAQLYKGTKATTLPVAAGDHEGYIDLFYPVTDDYNYHQSATCIEEEKKRWPIKEWKKIEVRLLPLKQIFRLSQTPIEFLSIDCEGMDLTVLKSAGFSKEGHLPRLVMMEHNDNHDGALDGMDSYLKEFGYSRVYMNSINAAWGRS